MAALSGLLNPEAPEFIPGLHFIPYNHDLRLSVHPPPFPQYPPPPSSSSYYYYSPPPPPPHYPAGTPPTISYYQTPNYVSCVTGHPADLQWQMMMDNPPLIPELVVPSSSSPHNLVHLSTNFSTNDHHHQISSSNVDDDQDHQLAAAAAAEIDKQVVLEEVRKITSTPRSSAAGRSTTTSRMMMSSRSSTDHHPHRPPYNNSGTFRAAGRGKDTLVQYYYSSGGKRIWKPKSSSSLLSVIMSSCSSSTGGGGGHPLEQQPSPPPRRKALLPPKKRPVGGVLLEQIQERGTKSTVMIKNIPNKYTREMLVQFLDNHCKLQNEKAAAAVTSDDDSDEAKEKGGGLSSAFDFVYLPIDFKFGNNKGYAFVNFTNPSGVWKLYLVLNNYRWGVLNSKKICEITYARIQGKEALVKHFEGTRFECDKEEFLPVYFEPPRDGCGEESVIKQWTAGKCVGCSLPSSSSSSST